VSKTAIFYDPVFLKHDTGAHPESADRLMAVLVALESAPFADRLEWITPDPASIEQLEAVHDPGYIRYVEDRCLSGARSLDADTIICPDSWRAATTAAGALIEAVDCVMDKSHANAFCAVRPPGHHAEKNRAMGFCLFNNVAIGVRHAQKAYGAQKTAIIDFDVHHGNGTQNAFYDDPYVFFVSLHQAHHYPGTGMESERGGTGAKGTNMNIPMGAGAGDEEYYDKFDGQILPALTKFRPDIIFISAGFDAHADDPLAGLSLTAQGYAGITKRILDLAGPGPVVSTLEGGYNIEALTESVLTHVARLAAHGR